MNALKERIAVPLWILAILPFALYLIVGLPGALADICEAFIDPAEKPAGKEISAQLILDYFPYSEIKTDKGRYLVMGVFQTGRNHNLTLQTSFFGTRFLCDNMIHFCKEIFDGPELFNYHDQYQARRVNLDNP